MSTAEATEPEVPADPDPLSRLIASLMENGFIPLQEEDDFSALGEQVYVRREKVVVVKGETIFLFIEHPSLTDKIMRQAMDSLTNLFRARHKADKLLSVLQSRTIYVCFVSRNEIPLSVNVNRYITSAGGAVLIPVIIVPEINQVLYPVTEEKLGVVKPRLEYLQFLLGERFDPPNIHSQTVNAFYLTSAIALLIVIGVIFSLFT